MFTFQRLFCPRQVVKLCQPLILSTILDILLPNPHGARAFFLNLNNPIIVKNREETLFTKNGDLRSNKCGCSHCDTFLFSLVCFFSVFVGEQYFSSLN